MTETRRLAGCCLCICLATTVAGAQETREGVQAAREAEKARRLTPQVLPRWERRVAGLLDGFVEPQGIGGAVGSVYTGSWLAVGPAYRHILSEETTFAARGLYSLRGYALAEATLSSAGLSRGRVDTALTVRWMDAKAVPFYGVGPDSAADSLTQFRMRQTAAGGSIALRPVRGIVLAGALGIDHYDTKPGDGREPSIETRFDPPSAPGLGADPTFVLARFSGAIDTRSSPGYSRSGGLYRAEVTRREDANGRFDFSQLELNTVQHVPVWRETIVFSYRGRLQSVLDEDADVPYFLLPTLGGGNTLRGYATHRFRDRHGLVLSAEYRWTPSRWAVDMALFADSGMVASRLHDLALRRLRTDVGLGVRFHAPAATPLRMEVAHGNEGWRFVFATSPAF